MKWAAWENIKSTNKHLTSLTHRRFTVILNPSPKIKLFEHSKNKLFSSALSCPTKKNYNLNIISTCTDAVLINLKVMSISALRYQSWTFLKRSRLKWGHRTKFILKSMYLFTDKLILPLLKYHPVSKYNLFVKYQSRAGSSGTR